jgi:ferritin
MLTKAVQDALNDQINKELYSSYLYLAMAAYCEANNLPGSAVWTKVQAQEEHEHAMKLFAHVNERGGQVVLEAIAKPPANFTGPLDVFEKVWEHEKLVTASIHKLYALAGKENDYATQIMLQWFITEQVEEEKSASEVVAMWKMMGEHKGSELMLDRQLGKRGQK